MKRGFLSLLIGFMVLSQPSFAKDHSERRLNTVTVTTLPPDKGELHINPVIRRPQDFQRPGFNELELVFVPVALIEDRLEPLLDEDYRGQLRLTTKLPTRTQGETFMDSPRDYLTQSVILPRGYYVLSEISFRQHSQIAGTPDLRTSSHCLADESFMLHVKGGDVMFMGLLDVNYPTIDRAADRSFNPAQTILDDLETLKGWRWTTKDLERFEVQAVAFERSPAFCNPESITPAS